MTVDNSESLSKNNIIDYLCEKPVFCRSINQKKSKHFFNPSYSPVTGKFLGYIESDEHFINRIKETLNAEKNNEYL